MESSCLRLTELPHTTRLFADFTYNFDRVARFYAYDPADPESYRKSAQAVEYDASKREAMVSILRDQNGDGESVRVLARADAVAVVTGQQVGLFSGPLYTIYKALTAVKLARQLTSSGIPAVPVFWLATEDHDAAEVNHCWVFDSGLQPRKLEVDTAGADGRPAGEIVPGEFPIAALRDALSGLPFADEAVQIATEAYSPGASLGNGFAGLLRRILGRYGLLFLDPLDPRCRELAAPILRRAVEAGPDLVRAITDRKRELAEAGYHAQVHVDQQTSLLFLLDHGKRIALHRNGGEYVANGRRFSPEELMETANRLSPNALLRPVVQDFMLPTVAYVGGPAEIAYLAQSQVIYHALSGRAPVAVHRFSATLADARAGKLLDRYGLRLTELFEGESAVRERIAAKLIPSGLKQQIERKRAEIGEILNEVAGGLSGFEPTLLSAFEKSRRKILHQLSKIEAKAGREAFRRSGRAEAEAQYVTGLLYPEKHLQERLYCVLPFLAKYGPDLVDRIYEDVQLDCPDHRVLAI